MHMWKCGCKLAFALSCAAVLTASRCTDDSLPVGVTAMPARGTGQVRGNAAQVGASGGDSVGAEPAATAAGADERLGRSQPKSGAATTGDRHEQRDLRVNDASDYAQAFSNGAEAEGTDGDGAALSGRDLPGEDVQLNDETFETRPLPPDEAGLGL